MTGPAAWALLGLCVLAGTTLAGLGSASARGRGVGSRRFDPVLAIAGVAIVLALALVLVGGPSAPGAP